VEPLNPDSKMWSVGTEWRGGYFQMRQFPRLFCFDIGGLWCYPALVKRGRHVCGYIRVSQTHDYHLRAIKSGF
jgi:hypothetical protein